jgi:uncharacterized protein (UPF0210 family)
LSYPVIRTITLGVAQPHPLHPREIEQAALLLRVAQAAYREAGYRVQTIRISTRSVFDDLADSQDDLIPYARRLQSQLDGLGIDQLSLGPAQAARPDFPLGRLAVIEDLLPGLESLSCAVQIATAEHGIRFDAAQPTARIMQRIAERTDAGIGNFRFAALSCVGPGHPFFPASYHTGPGALVIGLQAAGIVAAALSGTRRLDPASVTLRVRAAMREAGAPVVRLGQRLAAQSGQLFGGVDLSPAPSVDESIGAALEICLSGGFGAPGTIALVGAVTEALRTTGLPCCGYNGLMLPVLEDAVLARAWADGRLTLHQLLAYSAICGTGLDTVPLAGSTTTEEIAGLLLDMATLARRLGKPLSARLFPLPGTEPGDFTMFSSPYLTNIRLPGRRVP